MAKEDEERAAQMLAVRDEIMLSLYQVKKLIAIHLPSLEEKVHKFEHQAEYLIELQFQELLHELYEKLGRRGPVTDQDYLYIQAGQDKFLKAYEDLHTSLKKSAK